MTTTTSVTPLVQRLRGHFASGSFTSYTPPVWANPGDPPEIILGDGVSRLETKTSVSSPNWSKSQPRVFLMRRKGRKDPPVKPAPIYREFHFPKHPVRKPRVSDASWLRVERKFGVVYARALLKEAAHKAAFARAEASYARYRAGLERRNARRVLQGPTYSRRIVGKIVPSTNNPFTKTVIKDTGWQLLCKFQQRMIMELQYGQPQLYPADGPIVYAELAYYGTCASVPSGWFSYPPLGTPWPEFSNAPARPDLVLVATDKCVSQFYSKMADSSSHLGNMYAERAQTISMLEGAVKGLQSFLHSPKKSVLGLISNNPKTFRQALGEDENITKKISNASLQYAFGVEPFVKDIYQLATNASFSALAEGKQDMTRVRSGGSITDSVTTVVEENIYTDTLVTTWEVRVRLMAEYRLQMPLYRVLNQLGVINPAEVLWEITPWSFVIDWFLPIGRFIAALSADRGLEFRTGTTSTSIKVTQVFTRKYKQWPYLLSNYGRSFEGKIERSTITETKTREVLTAPPPVRLPSFKSPFSMRHIGLSLALWRQRF